MYNYFDREREVNKDIYLLRNIHELNHESQINIILNKIKKKIESYDTNYFIKQEDIINLYGILRTLDVYQLKGYDYYNDLIYISDMLYTPNLTECPKEHDWSDWDDIDEISGITQNFNVLGVIRDINNNNKEKYRKFLEAEVTKALEYEKYDYLKIILRKTDKGIDLEYKKIFDILFIKLKEKFDKNLWQCIINIAIKIDDEEYLESKNDESYICKSRTKYLKECVEYNRYYEYQEGRYIEAQKEYENSY